MALRRVLAEYKLCFSQVFLKKSIFFQVLQASERRHVDETLAQAVILLRHRRCRDGPDSH